MGDWETRLLGRLLTSVYWLICYILLVTCNKFAPVSWRWLQPVFELSIKEPGRASKKKLTGTHRSSEQQVVQSGSHHNQGLQNQHPSAFIAIPGDFNHVTMAETLPTFAQQVSCPTREEGTLDLLYADVKDVYSSSDFPPLGRSDHNLVHLNPCYVPLVQGSATFNTERAIWTRFPRKRKHREPQIRFDI